jgi:hypothetical protein
MAEIERQKGTTEEQLVVRAVSQATSLPYEGLTAASSGLSLWYRREGEEQVFFDPVALDSLDAPFSPGGLLAIDDGYYRLDVPDAALADGDADSVQVGGSADGVVLLGVQVRLTASSGSYNSSGGSTLDAASTTVTCDGVIPEIAPIEREGCPVRTKRRHIPAVQGVCSEAQWTMRARDGRIADLSNCVGGGSLSAGSSSGSDSGEATADVAVRFQGCDGGCVLATVEATVLDAAGGLIQFPIPEAVCQTAGIYMFQAAVIDADGRPRFVDGGLLSVEAGMWGAGDSGGPPTIEEIRFHLRDRATENTLLAEVEFDDAEILEAIRQPIRQFNETPPPLRHYNCNTFPYRYYWRNAIVSELLKVAAHHYLRNKLQMTSGGLSTDDKNKNSEYMQLAMLYDREWREFIIQKKVELNAELCWGSV